MGRSWALALILLLIVSPVRAQQLPWVAVSEHDEKALALAMRNLAQQTLLRYSNDDPVRLLNTRFRLQMVAWRYAEAIATIRELRKLHGESPITAARGFVVVDEVVARASALQVRDRLSFERALRQAFREVYEPLDNLSALRSQSWWSAPLDRMRVDLYAALENQKGKREITVDDAVALLRGYELHEAYRAVQPYAAALIAADDLRRYVIDDDVRVRTSDGAIVSARLVRPRAAAAPLPTLFSFTIYAVPEWGLADSKNAAANGYVGVVGYTRGKWRSDSAIVPYEHDGDDARAVIDWITRQSWSDGRIAMYGGSYASFTQWAVAKHLPSAVKALATSATLAPGIDAPMQGNIFASFMYKWPFYAASNRTVDDAADGDTTRWNALDRKWYASGRPYRELERLDGRPNVFFSRWLEHPSYDSYWQSLIPYGDEFSRINIPVLATTGYFDGAQISVLHLFEEHVKHNSRADHTLLIGPYEHLTLQTGVAPSVQGYEVEPSAVIDLQELRMQWLNHVLRKGPKPELLRDRVNFQVMGTNSWRHAGSFDAMGERTLQFYLEPAEGDQRHMLSEKPVRAVSSVSLAVDLADRGDVDYEQPSLAITRSPDVRNSVVYASAPLPQPLEVNGLFTGHLDFETNKKDLDLRTTLYELRPDGSYVRLSYYVFRASYAQDASRRQLLTPFKRQQVSLTSQRITARRVAAGSRLVFVVGINKQPDYQINYGTGGDVSAESIADAREPLQVKWFSTSVLNLRVR